MNSFNNKTQLARELRRNITPSENLLWQNLRGRKLNGLKFLRQHPIEYTSVNNREQFFIADFYCAEKKLVVEVDGKYHDFQKDYDENRNLILKELGMHTVRIKNEETTDIYKCLNKISECL